MLESTLVIQKLKVVVKYQKVKYYDCVLFQLLICFFFFVLICYLNFCR